MSVTPQMIDAMIAAGLTREQMAVLVKASLEETQAEAEAARQAENARLQAKEEDRLARQAERQQRRRRLKSHVEALRMCDNAVVGVSDVTKCDDPAPSLDGRPSLPGPSHPTLNPSHSPGSDAAASAEAVASPRVELSISDRIWVEFPLVLTDLSGRTDKSVRTWIGKVLAKYRAEDVLPAMQAAVAARTGDPFAYVTRVLNPVQPKQGRGSQRASSADFWAGDAITANGSRQRGSHDERPFDHSRAGGESAGNPGRHPAGAGANRGADGLPPQQSGDDPGRLPPLRLVGRA